MITTMRYVTYCAICSATHSCITDPNDITNTPVTIHKYIFHRRAYLTHADSNPDALIPEDEYLDSSICTDYFHIMLTYH